MGTSTHQAQIDIRLTNVNLSIKVWKDDMDL